MVLHFYKKLKAVGRVKLKKKNISKKWQILKDKVKGYKLYIHLQKLTPYLHYLVYRLRLSSFIKQLR